MRNYKIENLHDVDHVAFTETAKAEIKDYAQDVARRGYLEVGDILYFSSDCVESYPIFDLEVVSVDDDLVVFKVVYVNEE